MQTDELRPGLTAAGRFAFESPARSTLSADGYACDAHTFRHAATSPTMRAPAKIRGFGPGTNTARGGRDVITASELERELGVLLGMIRNFAPAHASNPERFHEEKSELAAFVQKLRDRQAGRAPSSERSFTTPARDTGLSGIRRGG